MVAEDARRRAADTSAPGRHLALIALDGACEYAVWLAARTRGITFKRSRPSLYEHVEALLEALGANGWTAPGRQGVEQLHRARNEAQHSAVAPDPAHMPDWLDAAWAFIDSLCLAVFGRALDEIVLADAVRDSSLHDQLRRSEEALATDPLVAFTLAVAAFREAREKWRAQRKPQQQIGSPLGGYLRLPDATSDIRGQLQDLDDFLEVQMFANDAGEYIWLRRTREEHELVGWAPTVVEARRALLFASSWIVRWEIFDRGYPVARWEAHRASIHPPETHGGAKPEIQWAQTVLLDEAPGRPARCVVYAQLANVPDRGRGPWPPILQRAVADAAGEADAEARILDAYWHYSGLLQLEADLGCDPNAVADIMLRAVEVAYERYVAQVIEKERRELQRQQVEKDFRDVIVAKSDGLGIFADVRLEMDERWGTNDWLVFLRLRVGEAGQHALLNCLDILRDALTVHGKVALVEDRIAFQVFELNDESKQQLTEALSRCEDQVRHLREHYALQQLAFQTFAAGIRDRFGEPVASADQ